MCECARLGGCPGISPGEIYGLSLQDVSVVVVLFSEYSEECVGNYFLTHALPLVLMEEACSTGDSLAANFYG
jgi:hypothetical protein